MEPITRITAVAAPLEAANVDTDQIIPAVHLERTRQQGYGPVLFDRWRRREPGSNLPEFVLDREAFRDTKILVAGRNFGCGSAREAAAYALKDFGIRVVIAPSFGEIHYHNEVRNGMLPVILADDAVRDLWRQLNDSPGATVTVDLEARTVTAPDGTTQPFEVDDFVRECLMTGMDEIDMTMGMTDQVVAVEQALEAEMPWLAPDLSDMPERG